MNKEVSPLSSLALTSAPLKIKSFTASGDPIKDIQMYNLVVLIAKSSVLNKLILNYKSKIFLK